jgi:nucleoside-diphosphate-sugar epimerase
MDRVLVTGAAGFIGSHIVEKFSYAGYRVRATDLPKSDFEVAREFDAEIIPANLLDPKSLAKAMRGVDLVVHAGALFDYQAARDVAERVNVSGVENVIREAMAAGARKALMISTVGVYGKPPIVPCPEDAPKRPRNNYEWSKWEGEKRAFSFYHNHGFPVVALRPALTYGPRSRYGHANFLGVFALMRATGNRRIWVTKRGPISGHVHVEDVAEATLYLIENKKAEGEAYNLNDDTYTSMEVLLRTLAEGAGLEVAGAVSFMPFLFNPMLWFAHKMPEGVLRRRNAAIAEGWKKVVEQHKLTPLLEPRLEIPWLDYLAGNQYFDNSKIKELGFRMHYPNFREGMREVIRWYKRHRWIPA